MGSSKAEKVLYKEIIDNALETGDFTVFYTITVALISADSNLTINDLDENIERIHNLIDVISQYNNEDLKNTKENLLKYLNNYDKFKKNIEETGVDWDGQ